MQIRCDVVAQKGEEAGNCESLVAVSSELKVYGVMVIKVTEERNNGIYRYHDQNADDTAHVSLYMERARVNAYCFCSYGFE